MSGCTNCRRHVVVVNLIAVLTRDTPNEDVHGCRLTDGRIKALEKPETFCGEHEPERRAVAKARAGRSAA